MSDKHKNPAGKEPKREMLPQYHLDYEKRIKEERVRVQNLVHDVLDISAAPKEKDISDDITSDISFKSFLKND